MKKGQGSLEYLIITAAVLAIAAVVVLFLTGAFTSAGKGGTTALCKQEAAACGNKLVTTVGYNCSTGCISSCTDATGKDVLNSSVTPSITTCFGDTFPNNQSGCAYCIKGQSGKI